MSACDSCYGPSGCYSPQGKIGKAYGDITDWVVHHQGTIGTKGTLCCQGKLVFDHVSNWPQAWRRSQTCKELFKNHSTLAPIISAPITLITFVAHSILDPAVALICMIVFPIIGACGTGKRAYFYAAASALLQVALYGSMFIFYYYVLPPQVALISLVAQYGLFLLSALSQGVQAPSDHEGGHHFICQGSMNSAKALAKGPFGTSIEDEIRESAANYVQTAQEAAGGVKVAAPAGALHAI